jgi:hypothetical protein
MSAFEKSNDSTSMTGTRLPWKLTSLPSERLLASGNSSLTGKFRSSSTLIMVSPTRPVAPSTATRQLLVVIVVFSVMACS